MRIAPGLVATECTEAAIEEATGVPVITDPKDVFEAGFRKGGKEAAEQLGKDSVQKCADDALKGTQEAFDAAQKAWSKLPKDTRSMMHGVNNGSRPLSDFTSLPTDHQKAILDYYRTTGANASKANAEAVQQLNQHRIDYLNGLRPDPPGPISNFPKPRDN